MIKERVHTTKYIFYTLLIFVLWTILKVIFFIGFKHWSLDYVSRSFLEDFWFQLTYGEVFFLFANISHLCIFLFNRVLALSFNKAKSNMWSILISHIVPFLLCSLLMSDPGDLLALLDNSIKPFHFINMGIIPVTLMWIGFSFHYFYFVEQAYLAEKSKLLAK